MSFISRKEGFVKLEAHFITSSNSSVYLKDIADVFSDDKNTQRLLENVKVYDAKEEEWDYVTAVDIVEKIRDQKSDIDITMLGEPEILIETKDEKTKNTIIEIIKILFSVAVLFFGAAMTIIYFHEDVNMAGTMEKLYHIVTGDHKKDPLILAIPYSIGLGTGMIVFFSRILTKNKRRRMEPGPLEVQMSIYDNEMHDYLIEDIKSKKE